MNEGLEKFRRLLMTDADFQEKFRKAAEAYTGEQDEKSVFENLILPVAKEQGLSATYDEFKEYIDNFAVSAGNELSEDELAQVAGGKVKGIGIGGQSCRIVGLGMQIGGSEGGGGICAVVGAGWGDTICLGEGEEGDNLATKIL